MDTAGKRAASVPQQLQPSGPAAAGGSKAAVARMAPRRCRRALSAPCYALLLAAGAAAGAGLVELAWRWPHAAVPRTAGQMVLERPSAGHAGERNDVPATLALRLARGTLAALDHANRTGDYTVLRALASEGFMATNSAVDLARVFADLRGSGLDLGAALVAEPDWLPAAGDGDGRLEIAGRIEAIGLDFRLGYVAEGAAWRLDDITVAAAAPRLQRPLLVPPSETIRP